MASCLQDCEKKSNGSKLSRLLIDGGTDALRQVFDRFHPPSTLGTSLHAHLPVLTTLRHKKVVNANQWDKLFPPTGATADSKWFDITLLFVLLRNICGLAPPATGWNNLPPFTDTTLEANLARIKYYRNEVYGHICSTELTTTAFEHYWKEISRALVSLGLDQISIDILETSPLGTTDYLKLLEDWSVSEHTVKEITEETKKEVYKTRQTAEETRKEVCKIREAVEEAKNVAEAVKLETAKTLKESVSKIDQLIKKVKDLNQTTPVDASKFANDSNISTLFRYNSMGYVNFLFNLFHPGTRKWVLDKVWQCLDYEQSKCVVITAQPGVGKSVLAAFACKTLQDYNQLAACHFIQHDNSFTNDPRRIIESVVVNLCETVPQFRQKLVESFPTNACKELSSRSCKEILTFLLEGPVNALEDPSENKVIVIDALDECALKQKDEFVKALFSVLPKLPTWLKFIMTTRPLPDMIPSISSVPIIEIKPENEENTRDIKLYLISQLCTLFKDSTLQQVECAVEKLAETCGGNFLVARFVIDNIKQQPTDLSQIHNIFPKGISSVYEEYFKCVLSEVKVEEKRFFRFLEAIVAAQEPLPETLVLQVLGLNGESHDASKTARSTLKSLLNLFPSHDGRITVFHKSVFDWLTKDSHQSKKHYFSVKLRNGHRVLAEHCYEYLQDVTFCKTFPPAVNDCERYALRFGFQHMLMAGNYEEQLLKCVNNLDILSAMYCTPRDEWFGMRDLCDQLEGVADASSSLMLHKFISNLKRLRFVSCQAYPQAVLQAAAFSSFTREQAVQLLSTPKYKFGYISPTRRRWDIPVDYKFIMSFQVSHSKKVAACLGRMQNHAFFVATFDVGTGKCIAVIVQGDSATRPSAAQIHSKTCVFNIVQGGWRPVACAISPDDKYVSIVTFFNIELRLVNSLRLKKTFVVDSEPNFCCFLTCDRKLVAGYCDSMVRVWSLGYRQTLLELPGHSQRVTFCTAAANGPTLTGDECGSLIVWHAFNPPTSIKIINGGLVWRWRRSAILSLDGSRIAALRYSNRSSETNRLLEVAVFSSTDGQLLATFSTDNSPCAIHAFIDDVRVVVGMKVNQEGCILNTFNGDIQRILFQPLEENHDYDVFESLGNEEYATCVGGKQMLSFKLCNIR